MCRHDQRIQAAWSLPQSQTPADVVKENTGKHFLKVLATEPGGDGLNRKVATDKRWSSTDDNLVGNNWRGSHIEPLGLIGWYMDLVCRWAETGEWGTESKRKKSGNIWRQKDKKNTKLDWNRTVTPCMDPIRHRIMSLMISFNLWICCRLWALLIINLWHTVDLIHLSYEVHKTLPINDTSVAQLWQPVPIYSLMHLAQHTNSIKYVIYHRSYHRETMLNSWSLHCLLRFLVKFN